MIYTLVLMFYGKFFVSDINIKDFNEEKACRQEGVRIATEINNTLAANSDTHIYNVYWECMAKDTK
jgi:hypothetical protein